MKNPKLAPVKYPILELETAIGAALALIAMLAERAIQEESERGERTGAARLGYIAGGIDTIQTSVSKQLLNAFDETCKYVREKG